jgi:hypothetical protein
MAAARIRHSPAVNHYLLLCSGGKAVEELEKVS